MKYRISFRKTLESDLGVNRPFIPENDSYEMYFSALIEDIENLGCVTEVNLKGNNVNISVENELDFEVLHSAIKELLNNQFHDKLIAQTGFSKVV